MFSKKPYLKRILWVDSVAAMIAGLVVLSVQDWLASLYNLPHGLIVCMGAVNLAYGSYSGTLALRARRDDWPAQRWIDGLIVANLVWAAICIVLILLMSPAIHLLGCVHLLFESAFVAVLAVLEFRFSRSTIHL